MNKRNGNLICVNCEDILSKRKRVGPLEEFKLFYEEVVNFNPINTRIRRIRQQSSASSVN